MCGVEFADRLNTRELMQRLGIKDSIADNAWQGSLRWLGHVLRKDGNEYQAHSQACISGVAKLLQ